MGRWQVRKNCVTAGLINETGEWNRKLQKVSERSDVSIVELTLRDTEQ